MPIIQALECLKSWLGIIEAQDDDLEDKDNIEDVDNKVVEV